MKKFWNEVRGEKVKVGGQSQKWWFAFLIAAIALVAPLASHASEFPGMGAAYVQRLEQYRKISSLWLAPQALQCTVPSVSSRTGAVQPLSEAQEPPVPPLNTYHLSLNTIAPWSARGAYCDWLHIDLPDTFRFPHGLEYLTRITILAYGEVRCPRRGDATFLSRVTEAEDSSFSRGRNAASPLATLPQRVSIEPNISTVSHGLTPSNTYLIAWQNACVERSATNRVNAAIELFPDGSVTTIWQPLNPNQQPTTNHQQPVPPPGFHGHGQDADWVRATFPDLADEILARGYQTWLEEDAVGINLPNGISKVTVTVGALPDVGRWYLECGPFKVAIDGPGDYIFPLEDLRTYKVRTYPSPLPLTFAYDDGYREDAAALRTVRVQSRMAAAEPPSTPPEEYTLFRVPELHVHPTRIPLTTANGSRVSIWCNIADGIRKTFRSTSDTLWLTFSASDAEIHDALVEQGVEIIFEKEGYTISKEVEIYDDRDPIDDPPDPEDSETEDLRCAVHGTNSVLFASRWLDIPAAKMAHVRIFSAETPATLLREATFGPAPNEGQVVDVRRWAYRNGINLRTTDAWIKVCIFDAP